MIPICTLMYDTPDKTGKIRYIYPTIIENHFATLWDDNTQFGNCESDLNISIANSINNDINTGYAIIIDGNWIEIYNTVNNRKQVRNFGLLVQ